VPSSVLPARDFASLGVPAPIAAALADGGITEAFPIQSATLPDTLAGRDVIGRGRTGSGKTVAFAIPVVAGIAAKNLKRTPRRPHGLVLVPTRELAAQVAETLVPLAKALGQRVSVIHGGVGAQPQVNALTGGVDIVIACPGRLEDLIAQGHCRLDQVAVTVLDEADHMADLGFLPAVKRLLDQTPKGGQRLLFSATLDNGVDVLVKRYLVDPVSHAVDSAESPVPDMEHHVLCVDPADKAGVVRALASGTGRSLLFTRTKHSAKKLARQLTQQGIPTVDLHGNLSQNARTRNLEQFAAGEVRVLVATDIAARGIHVDDVEIVVHVDPPAEHKAYLHRSGRTARAGASGIVVTVMTPDQRRDVDDLARKARIRPTTTTVRADDPFIGQLTGEQAALVPFVPAPAQPVGTRPNRSSQAPARSAGGGGGGGGTPKRSGQGRHGAGRSGQGRSGAGRSGAGRSGQGRSGAGRPRGAGSSPRQSRNTPA
jgi:superfamily II DNA/RNA helicase